MLDTYVTSVNNRMSEIMKVLTVIATIFMPLTFIVGLYGMNFKYMPESEWILGYPIVTVAMLCISVALLGYFKKEEWIWHQRCTRTSISPLARTRIETASR